MNEQTAFERFVADQFMTVDRVAPPAHAIDDILDEARRTRPLPRWLATVKEPPMRIASHVAVGSPFLRVASLLVIVAILSALTVGGIAVGAALLASPTPDGPRTIVVAADGTGHFTTISQAIAVATDGDTIRILPGTYQDSIHITADITLMGDGPAGSVIIEWPSRQSANDQVGISVEDSNAHLVNLLVRGPSTGRALVVSGGAPTLEQITVEHTDERGTEPGYSFDLRDGTSATLRDSLGGGYLSVSDGASPTIERLELDAGGFISDANTMPIIRDSAFTFALDISGGAVPTIEGSDLIGILVMGSSPVIRGNTFANPAFVAGASGERASEEIVAIEIRGGAPLIEGNRIGDHEVGISISAGSAPTIQGNRIEANTVGVEITAASAMPNLSGNTFCRNGTHLTVAEGSDVNLDDDTICEPGTSAVP